MCILIIHIHADICTLFTYICIYACTYTCTHIPVYTYNTDIYIYICIPYMYICTYTLVCIPPHIQHMECTHFSRFWSCLSLRLLAASCGCATVSALCFDVAFWTKFCQEPAQRLHVALLAGSWDSGSTCNWAI